MSTVRQRRANARTSFAAGAARNKIAGDTSTAGRPAFPSGSPGVDIVLRWAHASRCWAKDVSVFCQASIACSGP